MKIITALTLKSIFFKKYTTEISILLASKVTLMIAMIMIAFGAQALIGFNYSAGNKERLRQILKFDLLTQMVIAFAGGTILMISAPWMIRLFLDDPVIVEADTFMPRNLALGLPFIGIFLICSTLFMSAGKSLPTLLLSLSRQGIVFALVLWLLSSCLGYSGVVAAQPAADLLSALLGVALLKGSGIEL